MNGYILSLIILLIAFGIGIFFIDKLPAKKYINAVFITCVTLPYIYCVLYILKTTSLTDWNFLNALPTANASPFTFCLLPLCLILPKKVNAYLLTLIPLLSVGMFIAGTITCLFNFARDYNFYFHFILDTFSHYVVALFGIYLVKSKQVKLTAKNCLISSSIVFAIATAMLILNLIFDTAFFGLSLNGKHNIYNVVICKSSVLSALLYFLGLAGVLTVGYTVQKFVFEEKPLLKVACNRDYENVLTLLEESFPPDERRSKNKQLEVFANPKYKAYVCKVDKKFAGVITAWQLDKIVFIEHFAVSKLLRNNGLGSKILTQFCNQYDETIVLEAEPPVTEIAKRRIAFYQRQGFLLNDYDYIQPAYDKDKKGVPLKIMSYGKTLTENEFLSIKNALYKGVYGKN